MECCCTKKETLKSEKAPVAIGPYSPGYRAGNFIFTSGQLGINPVTGAIVEGGIEAETRQALTNVKHILEAGGVGLEDVVKTTVFLRDIADFAKMNAVYGEFFKENPPARSTFQVAALPKAAAVEIETIVMAPCECECDCGCGDECDCSESK
jgi:2-iminobutanoate/2-iminopropanoate deaminase